MQMGGENVCQQLFTFRGEADYIGAAIIGIGQAGYVALLFQILDDNGHVAAGGEGTIDNVANFHRAQVVQCLQNAELGDGEIITGEQFLCVAMDAGIGPIQTDYEPQIALIVRSVKG